VKGEIIGVNGEPATGTFVCRVVVFTNKGAPLDEGVAQVSVSWHISSRVAGRGIIFGSSLQFRNDQPSGAVTGGTGSFRGITG
jgi:hypothetical protein